ncbi:family 10 glycosylhydrolase [Limibacter armeniacum]|uniref:family 10 glycosylhydrolase n=1 Tax=Limibacter armeniacum TaxID=466084 RepID=UPI002FE60F1A
MKRIILFCLGLILLCISPIELIAQEAPEKELRAVWFATVSNLDWPKREHKGNKELQQRDLRQMLDKMKALNMNAIFLQIRPESDALYQSDLEPWSRFLTGEQGKHPGYDPLQFAIEEAHKRGMELHAWMNPYRINASTSDGGTYYAENHVYQKHPEWTITYEDNKKILNPGLPEVSNYIAGVVADVITRYDVDGIHFDDYFYSYDGTSNALDQQAYDNYKEEGQSRGDFRRGSINKMVEKVYNTIKTAKPFVRFGISPFGIWSTDASAATKYDTTLPTGIVGLDAYNQIYCDPLAWLKAGTVDYITPQLYWPTGGGQDYETLINWWAQQVDRYGKHMYVGQGIHRFNDNPVTARVAYGDGLHEYKAYFNTNIENYRVAGVQADWTFSELTTQLNLNRANETKGVKGSVYFRANDFWRVEGLAEHIVDNFYEAPVMQPEISWQQPQDNIEVLPNNIRLEENERGITELKWDHPQADSMRFILFEVGATTDTPAMAENYRTVVWNNAFASTISKGDNTPKYYALWTYDRQGYHQATATEWFMLSLPEVSTLLTSTDTLIYRDGSLKWSAGTNAMGYLLEISTTADFSVLEYQQDTLTQNTFDLDQLMLEKEVVYYWRIKSLNSAGESEYTEAYRFTVDILPTPVLVSPEAGQEEVELQPTFSWDVTEKAETVHLQVIEYGSGDFEGEAQSFVVNKQVDADKPYQLEQELGQWREYEARIRVLAGETSSYWSEPTQFKTLQKPPKAPIWLLPLQGAENVEEESVQFEWSSVEGAQKYQLQLATDATFENLVLDKFRYTSTDTAYISEEPLISSTVYYARVRAGNQSGGMGEWSAVISFTTSEDTVTALEIVELKTWTVFPNPAQGVGYLDFSLDKTSVLEYSIVGVDGKVLTYDKQTFQGGKYRIRLNANSIKSGIYLVVIRVDDRVETRRWVVE